MLGEALVPSAAGVGSRDGFFQDRPACSFERLQCGLYVLWMRGERAVERDCVLHGEPRARSDGEMGGVQGIADQDVPVVPPVRVADDRKLAPDRPVAHQSMTV